MQCGFHSFHLDEHETLNRPFKKEEGTDGEDGFEDAFCIILLHLGRPKHACRQLAASFMVLETAMELKTNTTKGQFKGPFLGYFWPPPPKEPGTWRSFLWSLRGLRIL